MQFAIFAFLIMKRLTVSGILIFVMLAFLSANAVSCFTLNGIQDATMADEPENETNEESGESSKKSSEEQDDDPFKFLPPLLYGSPLLSQKSKFSTPVSFREFHHREIISPPPQA
jgi:hypothetical protein